MMRVSRLPLLFLALTTIAVAQDQPAASKNAVPVPQSAPGKDVSSSVSAQPAVDAATVKGSTFTSEYFKFTYELPAGWKALDDSVRMKSNREVLEQDAESAKLMAASPKRISSKKAGKTAKAASDVPAVAPVIERYSLMAASSNGVTSLASNVLPRVNIWAHRRVPPFDTPMDQVRLAIQSKYTTVLTPPQDFTYNGHTFARVELVTPGGQYRSRYVITMGDFLVGFDFWTGSQRELVELSDTIKSVHFE